MMRYFDGTGKCRIHQCLMLGLCVMYISVLSKPTCPVTNHTLVGHYKEECFYLATDNRCYLGMENIQIRTKHELDFFIDAMKTHAPGICILLDLHREDNGWVWTTGEITNFTVVEKTATIWNPILEFIYRHRPLHFEYVRLCPPEWTWKSTKTHVFLGPDEDVETNKICKLYEEHTKTETPVHIEEAKMLQTRIFRTLKVNTRILLKPELTTNAYSASQCARQCDRYSSGCNLINYHDGYKLCRLYNSESALTSVEPMDKWRVLVYEYSV